MDKKRLCAAFMTSVTLGDKSKAKSFIKLGADVEFVDPATRRTVLYQACIKDNEPIAKMLIKHRASPNQRCGDGSTAVHAACLTCNVSLISCLVDAGGDLRLHDRDGKTPRDWAMKHSDAKHRRQALDFIDRMQRMAIGVTQTDEDSKKGLPPIIDIPSGLHARYGNFFEKRTLGSAKKLKSTGESSLRNIICVQNLGFGQVRVATGDQPVAPLGHVPFILLRDMHHDTSLNAYCNGPYMVMEGMIWNRVPVTVKRLHQLPVEGGCIDMLIKESDYMLRLRHPNVLLLMGVCQTDQLEGLVLVYERITTGSLHHVLYHTQEELSLSLLLTIFRQTCDAVLYMHDNKIVHGLITSHAIQLVTVNYAKIGNLEYAVDCTATDSSEQWMPYPKECYGSLSPELLNGQRPTVLSDIYGLTITLWEVLHGQEPWLGLAPMKIVEERLQLGRSLPIDESEIDNETLCSLLDAGMSFDPAFRPPTVDSFKDWLMDAPRGKSSSSMQQNISSQRTDIDNRSVNNHFTSPSDYSTRVRPKSKTSSMVTPTVSFNRHNSRRTFHIQNALGPSESDNHSNFNEQRSTKWSVQHFNKGLGQTDNVMPSRTTTSRDSAGVVEVDQIEGPVVPISSVGIADGKLQIRDVRDFMQSTPQSQSPQPDVLERTAEHSEQSKFVDVDDRQHGALVTRLQLNFSPVDGDSDEMTSGDEEKRIPVIEPVFSTIQIRGAISSFHEQVNQLFCSTIPGKPSSNDNGRQREVELIAHSSASVSSHTFVQLESALSKHQSTTTVPHINDSHTETRVDRGRSAVSISSKLASLRESQTSIRNDRLREMRTAFFSSNSFGDVSGERPQNENASLEFDIAKGAALSGSSASLESGSSSGLDSCLQQVVSIDKLTAHDVQMFKDMVDKPLPPLPKYYMQPIKTDSVKSSTLPVMKVLTIHKMDLSDVYSSNDSPTLCSVPAQSREYHNTVLDTPPSWTRSSAASSSVAGLGSAAPSSSVFHQTKSSIKPSPLVSRSSPAAQPSPMLHRRGFKPANHCEPSMVVHLPVDSTPVSKPFMTPPTRHYSPTTCTRYCTVSSAIREAPHMSHVNRLVSAAACLAPEELDVLESHTDQTYQSDPIVLQNGAYGNPAEASSSSENSAHSHLHQSLGGSGQTVRKQLTDLGMTSVPTYAQFQGGAQVSLAEMNLNCSHDFSRSSVNTGNSDSFMVAITRDNSIVPVRNSADADCPTSADSSILEPVDSKIDDSFGDIGVMVETNKPNESPEKSNLSGTIEAVESKSDASVDNVENIVAITAATPSDDSPEINHTSVEEKAVKPNGSDIAKDVHLEELLADQPMDTIVRGSDDIDVTLSAATRLDMFPESIGCNNDAVFPDPSVVGTHDHSDNGTDGSILHEQFEHVIVVNQVMCPESIGCNNDAVFPDPSVVGTHDHSDNGTDGSILHEQFEHVIVVNQENQAVSVTESVASSVAVADVGQQMVMDLTVRYKESDIGRQVSDLALTTSESLSAVFDGDKVCESLLELSAEDLPDMLPPTFRAIASPTSDSAADSPGISMNSLVFILSESSMIDVPQHHHHHRDYHNTSMTDPDVSNSLNEHDQPLARGNDEWELQPSDDTQIQTVEADVDDHLISERFYETECVANKGFETEKSVTSLTSKISHISSKSSEVWPQPPADNESKNFTEGCEILSDLIDYQDRKLFNITTAEESTSKQETVIESQLKTAIMKVGVSEKVFGHPGPLENDDSMHRFRSDPILRHPSTKADEQGVLTAAPAAEENITLRNDKSAVVSVPRFAQHHHSTLEGAAEGALADLDDLWLRKSAYDSVKPSGKMGQYVTVAPVLTRFLDRDQPLWTVRSRGDTSSERDEFDTKKSVTTPIRHTCLVRTEDASDGSDEEDDVDVANMVESAIRLASTELVHKYTHSLVGHGSSACCAVLE